MIPKRTGLGAASVVSAIAGVQLFPYVLWSPEQLAEHGLMVDDAFFYSVLARNFHEFGFLTLDGIMPTNGVQPLWMFLLVICMGLIPGVHEVSALGWLSWTFYLLTCFTFTRYVARQTGPRSTMVVIILALTVFMNPRFQTLTVRGLETPLALFLLALMVVALDRYGERPTPTAWDAFVLGVLGGLAFLARTDLFWVAAVVGVWLVLRQRPNVSHGIAFWAGCSALVLPYLAYNFAVFGSLVPISGQIKIHYSWTFNPTFSDYVRSGEWLGLPVALTQLLPGNAWLHRAVVVVCAYAAFATAVWAFWRKRQDLPIGLMLVGAAIILHAAFMQFVYRVIPAYSAYYFAPEVIFTYLTGAFILTRTERLGRVALTGAALICITVWLKKDFSPSERWKTRVAFAQDVSDIVPEGTAVGAFWPGCFAQFSERSVIPLDGIIGSRYYFENYVRTNRHLDYLFDRGYRHLAIQLPTTLDRFFQTPLRKASWGELGQVLLQSRRDLTVKVLRSRVFGPDGQGWYLLELTRKVQREGPG